MLSESLVSDEGKESSAAGTPVVGGGMGIGTGYWPSGKEGADDEGATSGLPWDRLERCSLSSPQ